MNKETRTIVYDDELQIEAYSLNGFVRAFPKHFHEYYVFGLMNIKIVYHIIIKIIIPTFCQTVQSLLIISEPPEIIAAK